ncbi:molybdopterin-guanine dinucleotide biosynthesis protein B [Halochromatium glycolicum]|uniref:Molybdopterin-guanine dinucleotide biosynthesis protein B n=1 Tax=Halochromatium glycolicum TaxID=85075 RepID=A0AAJ0XA02_9GAMM|nr:molybdopterin-guanine dinucleotide biosynthesis protein B [Halochromatium glycolicum]
MDAPPIPAIGFVAPSGSGKTTLLRKLVPLLRQRGLRIGYLKHAHHGFALDRPGKDSYEVAAAGARQVMLVSGEHWALLSRSNQRAEDHPAGLDALRARFDADSLDLLLIEGFRGAAVPKIEVFRAAVAKAPLYPQDDGVIAVASDDPLAVRPHPPVVPLSDPEALADLIAEQVRRQATPARARSDDPREALIGHLARLRLTGSNEAEFGSASVRRGEHVWITPSAGLSDAMSVADLIACSLDGAWPNGVAVDAPIHRAVYRQSPETAAILHSRGPHSVAASFAGRDFEPPDLEGMRLLGSVPVLDVRSDAMLDEAPSKVAQALASSPVCLIARQGVYACGKTVRNAAHAAATLELSARIHFLETSGRAD